MDNLTLEDYNILVNDSKTLQKIINILGQQNISILRCSEPVCPKFIICSHQTDTGDTLVAVCISCDVYYCEDHAEKHGIVIPEYDTAEECDLSVPCENCGNKDTHVIYPREESQDDSDTGDELDIDDGMMNPCSFVDPETEMMCQAPAKKYYCKFHRGNSA